MTHMNLSVNLIGGTPYESGALFSFDNDPSTVLIRVGVSFVSSDQACANAESEIGNATFEEVWDASKSLWNERLSRIEIDVPNTPPNVTEMFYSSLYRASLTPVSLTLLFRVSAGNGTDSMYRIMRPERRRVHLPIRLLCTLIRSIAGDSSPASTRLHSIN